MGLVYKYYQLVWKTAKEETFKFFGWDKKTLSITFCLFFIGLILLFLVAGLGKLKEELLTYIPLIFIPTNYNKKDSKFTERLLYFF